LQEKRIGRPARRIFLIENRGHVWLRITCSASERTATLMVSIRLLIVGLVGMIPAAAAAQPPAKALSAEQLEGL
jgi:hypothetical protein